MNRREYFDKLLQDAGIEIPDNRDVDFYISVFKLVISDHDQLDKWFRKPNDQFDDRTPVQVVEDGDLNILEECWYSLMYGFE